jgi:hypothetical protein
MLPTISLDDSDVNSHDSHNCSSLFYDDGGFVSLQNGKTQAPINVKDVQKASNRAKRIKYLEHQIKAAQVNVLDPMPRHSNHMKKMIAKAGVHSIDASQETKASKINLDRLTENPRANYARACLATPSQQR